MKSTGIVRRIDPLGRVVMPMELRRTYEMKPGDPIEIFTDDDKIILRKYQKSCIFCGTEENIIDYKDKCICLKCIENLGR